MDLHCTSFQATRDPWAAIGAPPWAAGASTSSQALPPAGTVWPAGAEDSLGVAESGFVPFMSV